ncbi:ParA family protein [Coleofasciculus sp. FACHB-501]|uniref:ParA family protein n=1 Tax=Cyanophyceae TaxID=3028117 RepID=UPI00168872C7|nr:ParA family protein [Coleofasciculus sp. FACHB-501]MBD1837232.1 ParA family protein [Coleofasciculus sp. FACHB-501]
MIIAIASLKGGCSKTTTAIHLAAYLQTKAPTLLIDADKNRSALTWARPEKLPFKVVSETAAPKYIKDYTHTVIDTQARPSPEDFEDLADGCDLLVLPTTPRGLDLDALAQTVEVLQPLGAKFKILLTQIPARSAAAKDARQSLEDLKLPIFKAEIKRLVAFERSPLLGVTVKDYPDPRALDGWKGYVAMGKEVLK